MIEGSALFVAGMFLWTFIEYLIHGWLSHTFRTFATRLHALHHRDAHDVFAIRAWLPIAGVWTMVLLLVGWSPWAILLSGIVAGFASYETVHYRIHFRRPRGRIEDYLRCRHLVHHECNTNQCFGVTSAIWDLAFGTEAIGHEVAALHESMRTKPPLTGRTNCYKFKNCILPLALKRRWQGTSERCRLVAWQFLDWRSSLSARGRLDS
jgi:sterol desaturase/sphingolipid hydroxylase (fatty acid hydroxylase superfamily)